MGSLIDELQRREAAARAEATGSTSPEPAGDSTALKPSSRCAVISNGDFDDYWRYHLAREHQRLYPGTVQGQYTLGA